MFKYFKTLIILFISFFAYEFTITAQVETPPLSPLTTIKQNVGLTELEITYSRPSKRGRQVFGNVVAYDQMWRLGANKNSTFTTSDDLYFGNDTLKKGTYAIFAMPQKQTWNVVFYAEYSNWGTPDEWEESKVVVSLNPTIESLKKSLETLSISIDNIKTDGAVLSISWDRVKVEMPFSIDTRTKVEESIAKVMGGPSANDYYSSAKYYYTNELDKKKALEWINAAVEIRGASAYWMTKMQAEILAWNGDYSKAIETAQISMKTAASKGNDDYVRMNEKSIAQWKKMK
ncbi:MAG: DUF2911 domain-containing protein [Crocinitomicaceae bacterium]|nr:DUF2911 domain-containing protein [Crocinitomicaceae bacterium]